MESFAKKLGLHIADSSGLTGERRDVMVYGFLALFQMSVILAVTLIVSLPFGFALQSVIVFMCVGLIRRSTGGFHSASMLSCTVQSCVVIIVCAALSRLVLTRLNDIYILISTAAAEIFALLLIAFKAPMDSPNKRITSEKKRRRLKLNSFIAAVLCGILALAVYAAGRAGFYSELAVSCVYAVLLSLLWQCFTLTAAAGYVIGAVDKAFTRGEK